MNFGGTLRVNKFACFILMFILFLIIYWRSGGSGHPTEKTDLVNIKAMLRGAIYAAERGGQKVIEAKSLDLNVMSKGKTLEGINDPVTAADYSSHCAMYYSLKEAFPKVHIISEEHTKSDSDCVNQKALEVDITPADHGGIDMLYDEYVFAEDVTIWIDPLDATKEYTEGLYQYVTTMACIAIKGVPVVGVIHYPFASQTYWGWLPSKVSSNIANVEHKEENKEQPRIVVSLSHSGNAKDLANRAFDSKATITSAAGAGYKAMGVANGTYDIYLHATVIKKWDLCAGNAILSAVDGKMTTLKGDSIDYSPNSGVKVTDGVLATRHDHGYYLDKLPKMVEVAH